MFFSRFQPLMSGRTYVVKRRVSALRIVLKSLIRIFASIGFLNRCIERHSSRNLRLNDSFDPFAKVFRDRCITVLIID
jgi:hypothetical protein